MCRINLENRVLVSCVNLLKTKFTISLSELRVEHRFLLLDEYLFQLGISSLEPTEAFTPFSDLANSFLYRQKSNNTAPRPWNKLSFEGDNISKPQIAYRRLIDSLEFVKLFTQVFSYVANRVAQRIQRLE